MVLEHAKAKIATLIVFTIICLLTFVYLFTKAGGNVSFSSQYHAVALMSDTFNLVPNSDVRSAGVSIGHVDSVEPAGQLAKVSFTITTAKQAPIYENATVEVRTKTLVGESYLDVNPGDPSAGRLTSGGVLPVSRAQHAVPLEKVLGILDPATRARVRADMHGLGLGLNGHSGELNDLFGQLLPTVQQGGTLFSLLQPQRRQLQALLTDTGQVLNALGTRTAEYQQLVTDAKTTAVATASRAAELRAMFDQLPATLRQARETVGRLGGFSGEAVPVIGDLRTAATDLTPAIRDLAPTATQARVLFAQLKPFLTNINPLFTQLRPAADKLQTVIGPLDNLLRQANPALAYFSPYAREFAAFFSDVGTVFQPDQYGVRGRVFGMVGPNQYTDMTAQQQKLLDAFISTGTFHLLGGTKLNPYARPGTVANPQPYDGKYQRVLPSAK